MDESTREFIDKEFADLTKEVEHVGTLLTGGDVPENGVLIKLDRLLQLCEASKKREERIITFALMGVGSGLTGFFMFLGSIALWWFTKAKGT